MVAIRRQDKNISSPTYFSNTLPCKTFGKSISSEAPGPVISPELLAPSHLIRSVTLVMTESIYSLPVPSSSEAPPNNVLFISCVDLVIFLLAHLNWVIRTCNEIIK